MVTSEMIARCVMATNMHLMDTQDFLGVRVTAKAMVVQMAMLMVMQMPLVMERSIQMKLQPMQMVCTAKAMVVQMAMLMVMQMLKMNGKH